MKKITFLLASVCFASALQATVFYVSPGGNGNGTGADWDNAFDLTTENLAKGAEGDEFWVKAGVYTNAVTLAAGRQMYGGFEGTETDLAQRDWTKNKTVLQGNNAATSSLVIMNESSVVDGFYIQDNQNSTKNGGGVTMMFKTTLRNCVVRNNSVSGANVGGGVFVTNKIKDDIVPTIENCLVYNNSAANNGGGIQVAGDCYLHLISSTVANNKITKKTGTDGSGYGCGVGLPTTSTLIAENSIVYNNGKMDADEATTLYFSFGSNYNSNNNAKSTVRHCAYDAINAGTGTKDGVAFVEETNCLNDLSEVNTPGFIKATGFIGCVPVTSTDEYEEIANADYRLAKGAACIDKGNNEYAATLLTDLDGNDRISNGTVDMGAYESAPTQTTGVVNNSTEAIGLYVANDMLTITGLSAGDDIAIYNALGKTVHTSRANGDIFRTTLPAKGIYIVKTNEQTQKIAF